MKNARSRILPVLLVLLCGTAGFLVSRHASPVAEALAPELPPRPARTRLAPAKPVQPVAEEEFEDGTTVQAYSSCRPDELILRFPSAATLEKFAAAVAETRIVQVDRVDRLLALRLAYPTEEEMQELLAAENVSFYPSVATPPDRSQPILASSSGGEPVGSSLMKTLGITGDNSRWGRGVKVAVLDSGVIAHPAFLNYSRSIAIVPFPADLSQVHGHATAVASLIAGASPEARGVAPAAEIISIKASLEDGRSDALFLASGILAAVDERVHLLNISMGQSTDNPLLADAVGIAQDAGIVIVAAAGNDGVTSAGYPADYPGVTSVGAVDARGIHMGFSNYGQTLSLTAPGYGVNAAWPGGKYVAMSGTSASTPLVTGAIAAVMSDGSGPWIPAAEAVRIVLSCVDDAGIPGPDTEYGNGILNVGRIMRRNTPGLIDGAVTAQRLLPAASPGGMGTLEITVQNQGTDLLISPVLEIQTPQGLAKLYCSALSPGQIHVFRHPVNPVLWGRGPVTVSSVLRMSQADRDLSPANNVRQDVFTLP